MKIKQEAKGSGKRVHMGSFLPPSQELILNSCYWLVNY